MISLRKKWFKLEILLSFFLSILVISSITNHNLSNSIENVLDMPNGAYTSRGAITIDGNGGFTAPNGVSNPGAAGTEGDPYYIEGWAIELSGGNTQCISISNTDKFFILRDCKLSNSATTKGMLFDNVSNAHFFNNTINNCEFAIEFVDTVGVYYNYNNTFEQNQISNCEFAIYLRHNYYGLILNNTITDGGIGARLMVLHSTHNSSIENNHIQNNYVDSQGCGIRIVAISQNNSIKNNLIMRSGKAVYIISSSRNYKR